MHCTITAIEFLSALHSDDEGMRWAATYGQLEQYLAEREAAGQDAQEWLDQQEADAIASWAIP